MIWIALGSALLAGAVFAWVSYAVWYFRWETGQTAGMAYYAKSLAERRQIKRRIRLYSRPVRPLIGLIARLNQNRHVMPAFEFEGVSGPMKVSSPDVFARAKAYRPGPQDVFVVTQMRCGTTWMQQIVYEISSRGRGDLGDSGRGHLYAVSPWIDGVNSVSMDDAPLIGERPTRLIKSHLPVELCPYHSEAKYIYVTRHPLSCFTSIVDYNRSLLGPLAPPVNALADWFCSDRMYWRPWPRHVEGWWRWASERNNVLFVHFEDMKRDLEGAVERVAAFLGYALTNDERRLVVGKCTFDYMKANEELFEMAPPTMFSVAGGEFLRTGASRESGLTPEVRNQILDYCRSALRECSYPVEDFYPDLADRQRKPPTAERSIG
jgi:hypothetical protein